jgi:hypothetical protein
MEWKVAHELTAARRGSAGRCPLRVSALDGWPQRQSGQSHRHYNGVGPAPFRLAARDVLVVLALVKPFRGNDNVGPCHDGRAIRPPPLSVERAGSVHATRWIRCAFPNKSVVPGASERGE